MDPFGKKNVRNNPTHQVSFLDQLKMKQAQRGVEKGNSEIVHESVSTKKAPVKNEGLSLPSESFNRKKKDNEFDLFLPPPPPPKGASNDSLFTELKFKAAAMPKGPINIPSKSIPAKGLGNNNFQKELSMDLQLRKKRQDENQLDQPQWKVDVETKKMLARLKRLEAEEGAEEDDSLYEEVNELDSKKKMAEDEHYEQKKKLLDEKDAQARKELEEQLEKERAWEAKKMEAQRKQEDRKKQDEQRKLESEQKRAEDKQKREEQERIAEEQRKKLEAQKKQQEKLKYAQEQKELEAQVLQKIQQEQEMEALNQQKGTKAVPQKPVVLYISNSDENVAEQVQVLEAQKKEDDKKNKRDDVMARIRNIEHSRKSSSSSPTDFKDIVAKDESKKTEQQKDVLGDIKSLISRKKSDIASKELELQKIREEELAREQEEKEKLEKQKIEDQKAQILKEKQAQQLKMQEEARIKQEMASMDEQTRAEYQKKLDQQKRQAAIEKQRQMKKEYEEMVAKKKQDEQDKINQKALEQQKVIDAQKAAEKKKQDEVLKQQQQQAEEAAKQHKLEQQKQGVLGTINAHVSEYERQLSLSSEEDVQKEAQAKGQRDAARQKRFAEYQKRPKYNPTKEVIEKLKQAITVFQQGNMEKAAQEFTSVINMAPSYGRLYHYRAISYINSNKSANAILDLSKVIELIEFDEQEKETVAKAFALRGKMYKQLQKLSESIEDLSLALEISPPKELAAIHLDRAVCYDYTHQLRPAVLDYCKYFEYISDPTLTPQKPQDINLFQAYYNKGLALSKLEEYFDAEQDFEKACKYAETLIKVPQFAAQKEVFVDCYFQLAQCKEYTGSDDDALVVYQRVVGFNANHERAQYALANLCYAAQHYQAAHAAFGVVLKLNPTDVVSAFNRAMCNKMIENHAGALQDFKAVQKIKPTYYKAYIQGAKCIIRMQEKNTNLLDDEKTNKELIEQLMFAIKILETMNTEDSNVALASCYFDKAAAFMRMKLPEYAAEEYLKVVQRDPNFAQAYFNRGVILHHDLKEFEAALEAFTMALQICPEDTDILIERGMLLFNMDKMSEAMYDWYNVLAINPQHEMAQQYVKYCSDFMTKQQEEQDVLNEQQQDGEIAQEELATMEEPQQDQYEQPVDEQQVVEEQQHVEYVEEVPQQEVVYEEQPQQQPDVTDEDIANLEAMLERGEITEEDFQATLQAWGLQVQE